MRLRLAVTLPGMLAATLLAGCGGVYSVNPASDDMTTRQDERLVGFWRVDTAATDGGKDLDEMVFVVGRRKDSERDLEVLAVSLKGDKKVIEESKTVLRATSIGEPEKRDYLSVEDDSTEVKKDTPEARRAWVVVRYTMSDADSLRVLGMDEKKVADDAKSGAVEGGVAESKGDDKTITVTLTGTTTALRAYLEKRGDAIFKVDKPFVLKRLRLK